MDSERTAPDREVERSSEQSFPASDPPAFTGTIAGCPDHRDDDKADKGAGE